MKRQSTHAKTPNNTQSTTSEVEMQERTELDEIIDIVIRYKPNRSTLLHWLPSAFVGSVREMRSYHGQILITAADRG